VALSLSVGAFYFVVRGQNDSSAARNVALCAAALVAVGAAVTVLVGKGSQERASLFADTNAALAALAAKAGLVVVRAEVDAPAPLLFDELRGTFRGVRVVVTIGAPRSDELATILSFPDSSPNESRLEALRSVADCVVLEPGTKLALFQRTPFAKYWTLTYDRLPETDVQRLLTTLDRAATLIGDPSAKAG
jgi:hypothetical protein